MKKLLLARLGALSAAAGASLYTGVASATIDTGGIQTALSDAGTTAGTVAGYVVVAVAAVAGVGLIISMIKRA